jgi:PHD/YefM family antitoxin component YafN of YafNO toxin-antitoxin module
MTTSLTETMSLTEDFRTVEELASHAREICDQLRQTGRPLAITLDGKPEVVLLTAGHYEWLLHLLNLSRKLNQAQEDVRAGRVQPLEDFLEELNREQKTWSRNHRKRKT